MREEIELYQGSVYIGNIEINLPSELLSKDKKQVKLDKEGKFDCISDGDINVEVKVEITRNDGRI